MSNKIIVYAAIVEKVAIVEMVAKDEVKDLSNIGTAHTHSLLLYSVITIHKGWRTQKYWKQLPNNRIMSLVYA